MHLGVSVSLTQRMIEVNGATLEVLVSGNTKGLTVCESHPFVALPPSSAILDIAGDRLGLVHVNARGTGSSSPPNAPGECTVTQHVADLEAVREVLRIERWVFYGETGGGCTSLLYALQAPGALSGLIVGWMGASGPRIVLDARSILSPQHLSYRAALASMPLQRHPAMLDLADSDQTEWLQLREGLWMLTKHGQPAMMVPFDIKRAKLFAEEFVSVFDVLDRLAEIRIPTLVATSMRDPVVPHEECERVHAGVRDSEFVVLESSVHGEAGVEPPAADKYGTALRHFLDPLD
jgi:pimeloyl-ACP methyl ester carboxylesterase